MTDNFITFLSSMSQDLCWLEKSAGSRDPLLEHCLQRGGREVGGGIVGVAATFMVLGVMAGLLWLVRVLKQREAVEEEVNSRVKKNLVPVSKKPESELTVVLDLDETLISFGDDAFAAKGAAGVRLRPQLKEFLEYLEEADLEVIIWTAATRSYSKCIHDAINAIKPNVIDYRVYRTNAWYTPQDHVKDLRRLGRDLDKVVMVENRAASGRLQPDNTILVPDFIHKGRGAPQDDNSLRQVTNILKAIVKSKQSVPSFLRRTKMSQHVSADRVWVLLMQVVDNTDTD
eukprot:TRINITY_DN9233_c0_g1_i2.p1 TRINITY_DN9233_c0_g1~~TRINITY_DN9233_c0_g1_i2.p1  ORF type:complete len:286 (+),score=63.95 TRINITY_DN9233_c0_g1_i2:91-948(+)